jgi:hypothetical protein
MAPHRVSTPDGRSIDVSPVVAEASDIRTSQDAVTLNLLNVTEQI